MRRMLSFIFIFYLFIANSAFSGNTGKVTGRIVDSDTKTGLPSVNVMILETKQGAITDLNGYYVILTFFQVHIL